MMQIQKRLVMLCVSCGNKRSVKEMNTSKSMCCDCYTKENTPTEPKKYMFCDDLWREIKEFAGIYNHNINWDKVLFKTILYDLKYCISFTYPNSNKEIPECHLKKDENMVRRIFWKKVNNGEFNVRRMNIYKGMEECIGTKKNKKYALLILNRHFKVWTLPNNYKVGDEIMFSRGDYVGDSTQRAGKIISIAKDRKSYKIDEYKGVRLGSRYNEYYDIVITYGWDKNYTTKSLIKSEKYLKPIETTYEHYVNCMN